MNPRLLLRNVTLLGLIQLALACDRRPDPDPASASLQPATPSGGAAGGAAAGTKTAPAGAKAPSALPAQPPPGKPGIPGAATEPSPRSRLLLDDGWRFQKGDPPGTSDSLSSAAAGAWILPTGNAFLPDPTRRTPPPAENLGEGIPYIAAELDDSAWSIVRIPHDYAIEGPYTNAVSSSMGRLPSTGVAWYRREFQIADTDAGKSFAIDIDGAMANSLVWVNGQFVGGWPSGYTSYRVDVSSQIRPGRNSLVIRVDNPVPADAAWQSGSSRWYPGAGIYRNVWLVGTDPVHVAQWGTRITTPEISPAAAVVQLRVDVDNDSPQAVSVSVATDIYALNESGARVGDPVSSIGSVEVAIAAGASASVDTSGSIQNPRLWGPPPSQKPQRYLAVTRLRQDGVVRDVYETPFGVRSVVLDPELGLIVNGERLKLNGVCLHHDLGPLGAAFNYRARERQLQILSEMGSNAIRTAHDPFEPEFLELADRLGFLVLDEAFDVWEAPKAAFDYNLYFADWHEQDLRALIRRDRNHPSVFLWSIGNEVGEQQDAVAGPALAERLNRISHEEDATRPTTAGMNAAEPDNPFSVPIDTIGLNYQGTGVRDRGAQYPTYHERFPQKFVFGTETVSTFSSRGVYLFPVTPTRAEPALGSSGIDTAAGFVSSYDLYHADWSGSPDEEFESQDKWTFVGGEFVWTGFDYLGEPTPLDGVASSSYFGIIDLAGLPKDRFYLYQAKWRPDVPMAHILPHWTWPERTGQVTPVHVYTSGDSAELFLNGVSLGLKSKGLYEYRLRWDDVVYQPGELSVVAYKGGAEWARDGVQTASAATELTLTPDRSRIAADGRDLSFVTVAASDDAGLPVPRASNTVRFSISGPGQLVATVNGDPTNRTPFPAPERALFSGQAIAVVRAIPGQTGEIVLTAQADGLAEASVSISAE